MISRPAEGRRLSWPEHTVGLQLAQGCLQMAWARFAPATWKLRVRYSPTRQLAPTEAQYSTFQQDAQHGTVLFQINRSNGYRYT